MLTPLDFQEKNRLLTEPHLLQETGYVRLKNGVYYISMTCPMKGVTAEMIRWWFWWHPQRPERYRKWYPGEHLFISYTSMDRPYFRAQSRPPFRPNTQYPVERIGKLVLPLQIDFITPEFFGFDPVKLQKVGVSEAVTGHVGILGFLSHTEMAHLFFETEDGLFLSSHFWLGERVENPLMRALMFQEETAMSMTLHCLHEYRNLAKILPSLYEQYGRSDI